MAFPQDVLTSDEHVVLHLHPHWKRLVAPFLLLALATIAAAIVVRSLLPAGPGGTPLWVVAALVVAAALVLWLGVWPVIAWRTTHYVFTDARVILQHGVLGRDRRDIPLARVNDHSMDQSLGERLFGCGTLTIESAGERGQAVLPDVPRVERVQTLLYELVDADRDAHQLDAREMRDIIEDNRPPR